MNNIKQLLKESARLENNGQLDDAIGLLSEAMEESPSGELLHERGILLQLSGQYEAAYDDFSTALHSNPLDMDSWLSRGWLLWNCLRRFADAIDDYKKATSVDPTAADPHQRLCLSYIETYNTDTAFGSSRFAFS